MRLTARRLNVLGIVALAAGAVLTGVGAAPAMAGEEHGTRCDTIRHGDTAGFTTAGSATATLAGDGVVLATGTTSDNDRVDWKYTFNAPVDADTVTEASYTTTKLDTAGANVNDAALPSYRIYVRIDGKNAVLVYEPYYQISGNPPRNVETTWNVLDGKFWTSTANTVNGLPAEGGGSYAGNKSWTQIRASNPDMLVTGIGLGLGTYNRGTKALTNDVHFRGAYKCVTHEWSTRFVKPTPSKTTVTPTMTQTPVGNGTTPAGTTSPPANPGCNPNYPQLCLTHDVDCKDITARNFTVLPADPYGLDGPKGPAYTGIKGIGCEDHTKPTPYLPGVVTTPTTSVVTTPTTSTAPAVVPGTTAPGSLAVTPADYDQHQLTGTLAAGVLLLSAGSGALYFGRRRRNARA